jgi:hypothetical protein
MHENWQEIAEAAMSRDPREYPFGVYTGGSFVLDNVRVFSWFKDLDEMLVHILEIEPRIHDLGIGDGLNEYQIALQPFIERVRVEGLTEDLRNAISEVTNHCMTIDWWGKFPDLCGSDSEFCVDLRERFRDDGDDASRIRIDEEDDFVIFLKDCGC